MLGRVPVMEQGKEVSRGEQTSRHAFRTENTVVEHSAAGLGSTRVVLGPHSLEARVQLRAEDEEGAEAAARDRISHEPNPFRFPPQLAPS